MSSPNLIQKGLRAALADAALHRNVRAFLAVVRTGESNPTDPEAYRALYGWRPGNGKVFGGFDDHPRVAVMSPWGWTSAAGAYQAMAAVPGRVKTDTWGDFLRACGPSDFSPASQDLFAVWCIRRRRALSALLGGRAEAALNLCGKEWASLPANAYGQPKISMERALEVFAAYGGKVVTV